MQPTQNKHVFSSALSCTLPPSDEVTVLTVACYFTQHLEDTMSVEPPPEDKLIILDITGPTLTEFDSLDLRGKWISLRITDFQGNFSHILSDLFTAEADHRWDVRMVE